MAQVSKNVQNNFIAGLKTDYTGLNFPENAATDTSNCVFSLIGDVGRRGGINYEAGAVTKGITNTSVAINRYKWNNVGGDGSVQFVVVQVGGTLLFYKSSSATTSNPLSANVLTPTVDMSTYVASSGSFDATKECEFADGNGYLFVFHPSCDPVVVTFVSSNNSFTTSKINIQIRDFTGFYPEPGNPATTFRPTSLTPEHNYNLLNQGWTSAPGWTASSTVQPGSFSAYINGLGTTSLNIIQTPLTFTVASGLSILPTQLATISVSFPATFISNGNLFTIPVTLTGTGTVSSYSGTTLVITVTSTTTYSLQPGQTFTAAGASSWTFTSSDSNSTISAWHSGSVSVGGYPSNADIWYLFKNSSNVFDPAHTIANVGLPTTQAPLGHYIVDAFNQNFSGVSGVSGLTSFTTTARPTNGTFFAGRVWFTGVSASQAATGDQSAYTWTETIYFSQVITNTNQFGYCYQVNDPTNENFFDLLPTDGGTAVIYGSGPIYKLFPVQNGLLVFAANGIWFITGKQGIGFAANDYTITKIAGIQTNSSCSFINVQGYPIFWNSEAIYQIVPGNTGHIQPQNITLGNIGQFYESIPAISKQYARGDYDPISFQIQWIYRSTAEAGITDRYNFDSILVHNTVELRQGIGKAFYPYTVSTAFNFPHIRSILFVQSPGGNLNAPSPLFKYVSSIDGTITFAEENDFTHYVDWHTIDNVGLDYTSYFVTGYNLKPQVHPYYQYYSQALTKHSLSYLLMFLRNNGVNNSYTIQSLWDYASSSNSGKFSAIQQITNNLTYNNYAMIVRRHRLRGRGYSLQIKVSSVSGQPFDIMGWSVWEQVMEAP